MQKWIRMKLEKQENLREQQISQGVKQHQISYASEKGKDCTQWGKKSKSMNWGEWSVSIWHEFGIMPTKGLRVETAKRAITSIRLWYSDCSGQAARGKDACVSSRHLWACILVFARPCKHTFRKRFQNPWGKDSCSIPVQDKHKKDVMIFACLRVFGLFSLFRWMSRYSLACMPLALYACICSCD